MADALPTISSLSREYGLPRAVVSALISEHDLPTLSVAAATVIPEASLRRLRPILDKLRGRGGSRRGRATATA